MSEIPKNRSNRFKTLRQSGALQKNRLGQRLLIGLFLFVVFGILVHFREVRVYVPEAGTVAKTYVVAQVDFSFPNREETAILRQQTGRDVGMIYVLSPKAIEKTRSEFEEYLIRNPGWRQSLHNTTFEDMDHFADRIKESLIAIRFTDRRTLKILTSLHSAESGYYLLPSSPENRLSLSPEITDAIKRTLIRQEGRATEPALSYILRYFASPSWPLLPSPTVRREVKELVEATVPEKFTRVQAGNAILDRGEKVTPVHVAMLRAMKEAIVKKRRPWSPLTLLGSSFTAFAIVLIGAFYLRMRQHEIYRSFAKLLLYATIITLTLVLAKVMEFFLLRHALGLLDALRYPLYVPFAAILIAILLNGELALFSAFVLTVIFGLVLAVDQGRFITANTVAGIVALLSCRNMRNRKEVFIVCGKAWLSCLPLFFIYYLKGDTLRNPAVLSDVAGTFFFLALVAILIVGLLPLLESTFDVMTDITLMEYMDPNNELLRRLSVEAPGTYQHCLVVGSIAEAAAQAIGANGLFCRVATLYHDIGKLSNPHYFTENQMGGFDIHQLLTPAESTQVIIAHVTDGETLARKSGLPESFINVIKEHHGTTPVYYFYRKQIEQSEGAEADVDENRFRYPGPKPRAKESAIIMMADTVEAASRSITDPSEHSIAELVEKLIGEKQTDRQFDHCDLTFKEFEIVKKTIVKNLSVARHLRIKYPEREPVPDLSNR
ncbi:MAG: HDIG domain-containing protein [Simkaniaceae bacterium]|nr:HDIG domain-containing protein [Simkaniaceae bacterium]